MASGHVNRTQRPNTWPHRPSLLREENSCQPGAVHTWPEADITTCSPNVCLQRWSQPVDATPILNRRDREYVLMSEKCRQGLTAAEKPELWHRWQPGIKRLGERLVSVTRVLRRPVESAAQSRHRVNEFRCPLVTRSRHKLRDRGSQAMDIRLAEDWPIRA